VSEVTFYQDRQVLITNARAVLGGTTYAMANITSVSMGTISPSYAPSILVGLAAILVPSCICCIGFPGSILLGILPANWSSNSLATTAVLGVVVGLLVIGGLGIAASITLALFSKPTHIVVIGSASGEVNAMASKNRRHIEQVVNALNHAIISRG